MLGQPQKKEVRDSHEADFESSQPNIKKQSELIENLYNPIMDKISSPNLNILGQRLNRCDIHLEQANFSPVFTKSCIKTDWESTVYEARFGNLRTQLKVIYFQLDSNILCENLVGSGGFGQVMRFKTSAGQFALKNIRYRKNRAQSVDLALQEVFMAKVLSALEVGPKFVKIFSYDSIVFKNCVQFSMEMCRTKLKKQEIENELKDRNLLILVKIMHSMRICHLDIKIENIAWSSSLNRLVFLDFSFTKFIGEPVGFKTETIFEGTFHYASPEMKKRCILQEKQFVDLYYNDLHCLESTWKQMESDLKVTEQKFIKKISEFHLNIAHKESQNDSIVNYFNLKMGLFEENIGIASYLVQKQKMLLKTFSRVVSRRELNQIYLDNAPFIFEQGSPSQKKETEIDNILVKYELELEQNPLLVTLLEIIEDGSQSLFEKAWQEDSYKQKMFFFIDVYSNQDLQNQSLRKNLLDEIYSQIDGTQSETSYLLRFRKVIEYYGNYFCKRKNIEVVEKIMSYFVLMHDRQTREKLEDMVLSILEQQQEYLEYSERNFKYFLVEIATMNPMSTWHYERYIQNSQNLIQQLSKKMQPTDSVLLQISETLRLIKLIKNYRIGIIFNNIDQTEQFGQIAAMLKKRGQEIREFTYRVFQYKKYQQFPAINAKNSPVFKDHLLEKCALQMFLTNCIITERIYSLKFLLESEQFLCKFFTLTHLNTMNIYKKGQKQKRVEICKTYQKIEMNFSWGLSNQCLWVLNQLYDKIYIANYLFDWFTNLRVSDVSNLERLHNLNIGLQTVIYHFLNIKFYTTGQKLSLDMEKKLGEIVLSLLQFTIDLTRVMKEEAIQNKSPQLEECIYFKQVLIERMRLKDMYHKGLALLLLGRVEQVVAVALEIADDAIKFQDYFALFGFISFVWEYCQQDRKVQVNKIILKLIPHLMKRFFRQNLLQSHLCLSIVLRAYRASGLINQALNCICELCCYVESNTINIANTNLFFTVRSFLSTLPYLEIKKFVQIRLKWQLSAFISCPAMTYVLHLTAQFLQQVPLGQTQRKRLMVILVMFVRNLPYGSFAMYRQVLYEESFSLRNRKIRTFSELRRLALQNTPAVFTDAFTSYRKGKHRGLFSREAVQQMVQSISRKAVEYFWNRKGKLKAAYDNT